MEINSKAWQEKYNKVAALAQRGVDGEKDNAQRILARMDAEAKQARAKAPDNSFAAAFRAWAGSQ